MLDVLYENKDEVVAIGKIQDLFTGRGIKKAIHTEGNADGIEKTIQEIKNNKSVDVVCIATSDKGYTDTVKELRRQGKKVVGIGEKKAPKELRDACSEFFEIK